MHGTISRNWCAAGAYIASMRITGILGAVGRLTLDVELILPTCTGMVEGELLEGAIAGMLSGLAAGTAYLIYVYPKFLGNPAC